MTSHSLYLRMGRSFRASNPGRTMTVAAFLLVAAVATAHAADAPAPAMAAKAPPPAGGPASRPVHPVSPYTRMMQRHAAEEAARAAAAGQTPTAGRAQMRPPAIGAPPRGRKAPKT